MPKTPWPRCSADGCSNAVREVAGPYRGKRQSEPDGKCSRHKIADTEYVAPVPQDVPAALDPEDVLDDSPVTSERIASLRDALREGVSTAEVAELVREQLLEGLRASKSIFTTCPDCKHRHPVVLPDLATRISATQKLIEEVEGKLQATQADAMDELSQRGREIERAVSEMSNEELALEIARIDRLQTPARRQLAALVDSMDDTEIDHLLRDMTKEAA